MKKLLLIIGCLGMTSLFAQVTSQQIGSSSNAFTSLFNSSHSLSHFSGTGTNGGSLAFLHRENTTLHTGTGSSSGRLRYAISTNGGTSWSSENGPINPTYTQPARYPSAVLFNKTLGSSSNFSDLRLTYACPTVATTWDGQVIGLAGALTSTSPSVLQEDYPYGGTVTHDYITNSMVERVPGEFWYCNLGFNGTAITGDITVYKGIYSSTGDTIAWSVDTTITPNHNTSGPGGISRHTALNMAFDPSGNIGYIAYLGDLVGGINNVFTPIVIKTTDGGNTWQAPEEINMNDFPTLPDSLSSTGSTGSPACAFTADLTVDMNSRPHFFVQIGNAPTAPAYNVLVNYYLMADFTQDSLGEWMIHYVAEQSGLRGTFGGTNTFTADAWTKISRTASGDKIFYGWTDTDNVGTIRTNNQPNLLGRALDIGTEKFTPITNWTINDMNWAGQVLLPQVSTTVFERSGNYTVPTVVMRLDSGDALMPVSHHYFSNITYPGTSFTQNAVTFSGCRSGLMSSYQVIDDICALGTGRVVATVQSTFGSGPFSFSWSNGGTTDTLSNLGQGIYVLTLTEPSSGCMRVDSILVNDIPGPQIDSVGHTDVTCFGGVNGSAFAMVSGGTAPLNYAWITGDTTASIINLTASVYNVTVTDANGCTVDTAITISEPAAVSVVSTGQDPSCFGGSDGSAGAVAGGGTPGYTYSWSNGDTGPNTSSTLAAGAYTITVTDTNGCTGMTTVNIFDPPAITSATSTFNVTCFGGRNGSATAMGMGGTPPFSYSWSNGVTLPANNNIPAGTFLVTITDSKGCVKIDSVLIEQPDMIAGNPTISNVSCFGEMDGSIMLNVTGGTGPFNFNWTNGGTTQDLTGLSGGTYAVTIIDANSCTGSAVAQVTEPPAMTLNATFTPDNGTGNGTATANVTGGNPPYNYAWLSGQTTKTITGLFAGNYIITVTDANGCEQKDTILVTSNVGIDDLAKAGINSIQVFPNPSDGRFHLAIEVNQVQPLKLEVYDLRGKAILTQELHAAKDFEEILDLTHVAHGIYFLRLVTTNGMGSRQLIVK